MTRYKKNGFTLVELLVVISIIALLVSILMPALSKAREQAKQVVCASNLKQYGLAVYSYAVENDGSLPPCGVASQYIPYVILTIDKSNGEIDTTHNGHGYLWSGGYLPNQKILFCPSEKEGGFSYDTFDNPWWPKTQHTGQTTIITRSSYYYFSREGSIDEPIFFKISGFGLVNQSYRKLSKVASSGTAIGTDTRVYTSGATAHLKSNGVNVLYGDGGVSFWNDSEDTIDEMHWRMDQGYLSIGDVYRIFDIFDQSR